MTTTDIDNEDSTPEKDLIQWEKLEAEWQAMNIKADTAQLALDHKFKQSLQGQGVAPTQTEQETLDDLWYCEAELRGKCDEFISERFS